MRSAWRSRLPNQLAEEGGVSTALVPILESQRLREYENEGEWIRLIFERLLKRPPFEAESMRFVRTSRGFEVPV